MNFNISQKLSDYIWINGNIIPWDDAYIHVLTYSLHYAGAVFEGERAYQGNIFKLMEHSRRLVASAEAMHLKLNYSIHEICQASLDILQKNNFKNAYIRPLVWIGDQSLRIGNTLRTANLLVLAQHSNPSFRDGLKIIVTPWKKVSDDAMPPQSKSSAHYAMISISQRIAQEQGYDDCLILDKFDNIAECSTTNIFFGRNQTIITPIADRFLNGITRQTIIEIAKNMGIEVVEARLNLDDIKQYNTCFSTGTSAEIQGISEINTGLENIYFSDDTLIHKLQHAYGKLVGKKI